jgi:putative aminopeptidase FrvX
MVITMINLLKELCLINGVSGDEARVREYICKKISGKCDYQTDPLGNIIAFKKGRKTPAKKLMISAHMDEVGMIVTSIKADGTMTVAPVGGVDARVAAGRSIAVGDNGMPGVIGTKAVHNLSDDEKKKAPDFDRLYVDIGAENRDEAEKYVSLGDRVCFSSEFIEFGSGFVKCKAIDDRFGCAVMIKLIESELEYDCWFTFVVQEEVGLRGAKTAAYTVNPDFALVLEATTAADIPMAADEKKCCILGKGPVVSHMDRSTVYDKELFMLSKKIAVENNISWQTKTMVAGGNDSGAIHITNSGVRTLAISVPCRYLHSPSCVIKMSDALESYKLAEKMITGICEL